MPSAKIQTIAAAFNTWWENNQAKYSRNNLYTPNEILLTFVQEHFQTHSANALKCIKTHNEMKQLARIIKSQNRINNAATLDFDNYTKEDFALAWTLRLHGTKTAIDALQSWEDLNKLVPLDSVENESPKSVLEKAIEVSLLVNIAQLNDKQLKENAQLIEDNAYKAYCELAHEIVVQGVIKNPGNLNIVSTREAFSSLFRASMEREMTIRYWSAHSKNIPAYGLKLLLVAYLLYLCFGENKVPKPELNCWKTNTNTNPNDHEFKMFDMICKFNNTDNLNAIKKCTMENDKICPDSFKETENSLVHINLWKNSRDRQSAKNDNDRCTTSKFFDCANQFSTGNHTNLRITTLDDLDKWGVKYDTANKPL